MSQYSVSSHGSSLRRRPIRCHCGEVAPLGIAWTKANLGCRLYENFGVEQCKFFDWYDEKMSTRAKDVIWSFMKEIDELKNKVAELKNKVAQLKKNGTEFKEAWKAQEEMEIKMNMLWGFLAISWIIIVFLVCVLVATNMLK